MNRLRRAAEAALTWSIVGAAGMMLLLLAMGSDHAQPQLVCGVEPVYVICAR